MDSQSLIPVGTTQTTPAQPGGCPAQKRGLGTPHVQARDLQIAGVNAMSSVDWPGKLVASVFTQGCPWRCDYCHNYTILDPRIPGVVDWGSVEALMARRHGLLDGVVFSGGEATRQLALLPAMLQVRQWGFDVGLHTAGPYPGRLRQILDAEDERGRVVSWVGLDIKALPGSGYDRVVGRTHAGAKAWDSLAAVLDSGVDYEVRLTSDFRGDPPLEIARLCRDLGVKFFAFQEVRLQGVSPEYANQVGAESDDSGVGACSNSSHDSPAEQVSAQIAELGFERYTFRPAQ